MVPPRDTSPDAYAVQIERLRRAGPAARVAMAADMSDAVLALAAAAIRRRHPEYDDAQVTHALIEHLHGRTVPYLLPTLPK